MKQLSVYLSFFLVLFLFSSCSDDDQLENKNVPEKVQQEFNARYPEVKEVQWDVVRTYYVARFNAKTRGIDNKYNTNVWFTTSGKFCQTDEDIEFRALPVLVQESFKAYQEKNYAGWKIDDCEILLREGMAQIYVIEIEKGDLEREISVSTTGDILKDVLDDDDEDEILPIMIPEEVQTALREIFPNTYSALSILELEIDDDEIEIDVIEDNRHKEVELDVNYKLVSIEYEVSFEEAQKLMPEELLATLFEMAKKYQIDLSNPELQKNMEIEVKETAKGVAFEIEIELNEIEFEVKIDEEGNITIEQD